MNDESATNSARVAYFSMEIALESGIPTYSGGLGVLAGDMLRSAADLGVPMVGITLIHRRGYFRQRLDARGNQFEEDAQWNPEELLEENSVRASVEIEGREVHLRAWKYSIRGISGHEVPVYLLDSDLAENTPWDRTLTDHLYGGDVHYRLCQEALLGIGGVRILRELGYTHITSYHMNEGHAALLALGLLEQRLGKPELSSATEEDIEAIRSQCVFTTHTPVPAGHDQFSRALMQQVLGVQRMRVLEVTRCCPEGTLNMTFLALKFSRYINGVAMHHGEISQEMFLCIPSAPLPMESTRSPGRLRHSANSTTGTSRSGGVTICTFATPAESLSRKSAKHTLPRNALCCRRYRARRTWRWTRRYSPSVLRGARRRTSGRNCCSPMEIV